MILSKVGFVTLGNKRGKISRLSPSFPLLLLYSSYYFFSFYGILSSSFPHCAMHCFMLRKQKDLNPHCNNNSNRDRHCSRYVKSYANKDSCAAMLHCCFAASEMAFSESSQPPLLHCIATSLQSHIKWQSELKQYNSRCFVALLQYYIRCQSELKADPATSLLCYNLCQPEHNTSLAASLLRCNLI